MAPFGLLLLAIVLWTVWRKKTRGKIPGTCIAVNVLWVCFLLGFHSSAAAWSLSLAKKLYSEGAAAAAVEFQVQGDYGFGPLGMLTLLCVLFLSLAAEFLGVMLVARSAPVSKWIPTLVLPLYILDSYLMYFLIARRAQQPTTFSDIPKSQFGFFILFGWLYLSVWQIYRSHKLDPLFVSWGETSPVEEKLNE